MGRMLGYLLLLAGGEKFSRLEITALISWAWVRGPSAAGLAFRTTTRFFFFNPVLKVLSLLTIVVLILGWLFTWNIFTGFSTCWNRLLSN